MSRLKNFKRLISSHEGLDAFLVTDYANQLYLSGFPGCSGLLISETGECLLYVHKLNYLQAKTEVEEYQVQLLKRGETLAEKVGLQTENLGIQNLAVDALTWLEYQRLAQKLNGEVELEVRDELIWKLRKVKEGREVELMRKAAKLTSEGMHTGYQMIAPGVREYEVAAEIEYTMRKGGSWGTAFQTIVASGPRSAFPHGGCTDRKIRKGDLVVVDIGATYKYYRSDMTRTICAGEPSAKQEEIYHVVEQAQEEAFQSLKSQAGAREVDRIARQVIQDAGYGKHFVHGLGHGVGLEAHEPPTLNSESRGRLEEGNVVTVEPGIYLEGFGGVRIEDTILVRKDKAEKLTQGSYSLRDER